MKRKNFILSNNGCLSAGRKGTNVRNKLKTVFLFFIIAVISLGCMESQKPPTPNETKIATPEPTPEQKLPLDNETKPLEINGTFETWSRGYWSNLSYEYAYFKVIANYSEWIEFLDEQGYFASISGGPMRLEGESYPGINTMPETIRLGNFNNYFVIAAMMGHKAKLGPEIEIENIGRVNNTVNITVRMYKPSSGEMVESAPYHIIIVKRELLPAKNSTFIFTDTEGKELGIVEVNE